MMRQILTVFVAAGAAILVVERIVGPARPVIVIAPPSAKVRPNPTTQALNPRTIMLAVDFDRTPLEQAISQMERSTGATLLVLWETPKRKGEGIPTLYPITLKAPKISLNLALRLVLAQVSGTGGEHLTYDVDDNMVIIRWTSDDPPDQVLRVYDVRDIITEAMKGPARWTLRLGGGARGGGRANSLEPVTEASAIQDLSDIIKEEVDRENWVDNGGRSGELHYFGGMLVISQTPANHQQIEDILAKLREGGQ
ncbi:MAG: hypothetical protein ACHRHE_00715 [Tepidisphaerales bacterium]